ncbi:MAG TPA: sulfatase, partial [Chitinophagaceae bacterium]|nr:sulfatase [Chitinophagaceae bacterium]
MVFLFFSVLICSNGLAQKPRPARPNFVFILVDDLGYSDLGCTGSRFYETPNIDKLAGQAAKFTKAYATCQVCSPSRASILTGAYPTRHGITDYLGAPTGTAWRKLERYTKLLPAVYQPQLALEYLTFPEVLKQNGYKTFFAGKWHLGDKGFLPEQQGFDVNKGGNNKGFPENYFSPYSNDQLEDGPPGENLDMRLADETVKFITTNKQHPFLVYLSFFAVHSPIQTTETKWKYYRDKAEQQGLKPGGFKMERRLPVRQQQDNPVYAGLVSTMDDAVGKVLTALEKLKLDQNTVVIFTSDNGGVVSGDNFSTSLLPLRGGKGYQWEGGVRVPLLIKVPWLTKKPLTVDVPVSGIDFFPSILALANINSTPVHQVDGTSIVPLLENKKIPER